MRNPYKIISLSSFVLAFLMSLIANRNDGVWGGIWYAWALMTIFFSVCYSIIYYVIKRRKSPHTEILILSAAITVFLATMDYLFWDDDVIGYDFLLIVFEMIVIGTMYTFLIWSVISLSSYLMEKLISVIQRLTSK